MSKRFPTLDSSSARALDRRSHLPGLVARLVSVCTGTRACNNWTFEVVHSPSERSPGASNGNRGALDRLCRCAGPFRPNRAYPRPSSQTRSEVRSGGARPPQPFPRQGRRSFRPRPRAAPTRQRRPGGSGQQGPMGCRGGWRRRGLRSGSIRCERWPAVGTSRRQRTSATSRSSSSTDRSAMRYEVDVESEGHARRDVF